MPVGWDILRTFYTKLWVEDGDGKTTACPECSATGVRVGHYPSKNGGSQSNERSLYKVLLYIPEDGILLHTETAEIVKQQLEDYEVVIVATYVRAPVYV